MQHQQSMSSFWKKNLDEMSDYKYVKQEEDIQLNKPKPQKLFGSDFVEIRPQGSAELSFGLILLEQTIQFYQNNKDE